MPALLTVKKQSLENDILQYGCVLLFSDERYIAHLNVTYTSLSRLWDLLTASRNRTMLQVESNGQEHHQLVLNRLTAK